MNGFTTPYDDEECVAEYDELYDGARIPSTCPCPDCRWKDDDNDE